MIKTNYTLNQLSQLVGIESRTIRSYVQMGLLRGPLTRGRNARYSYQHLDRLKAIMVLKDLEGLSLAEIRRTLLTMSESEISGLAIRDSRDYGQSELPEKSSSTALEYIQGAKDQYDDKSALRYVRSLKRSAEYDGIADRVEKASSPESNNQRNEHLRRAFVSETQPVSPQKNAPLDALLHALELSPRIKGTPRKSSSETWHRISISPDIELTVRNVPSNEELRKLERIADHFREILVGND